MSVTTINTTEARYEGVDPRMVGVAAVLVGLASLVVANFVTPGDNGGPAEFALTGSFTILVAAIVFGLVIPRAREAGRFVRPALILTALSVLGGVMFFSGLAQITAPAAVLLGCLALERGEGSRAAAWSAIVLSAILYAGTLTICVIG